MPRSNTGNRRTLPRSGISALFYDEFLRQFPNSKHRPRTVEDWEITEYFVDPYFVREWNNPQYGSTENFYSEEWNLTGYTPEIILIEPGYVSITEPWEPTHYSFTSQINELWEFEIEYITDSLGSQFYEEWEFDIIYGSDSYTEQLYEEWEN